LKLFIVVLNNIIDPVKRLMFYFLCVGNSKPLSARVQKLERQANAI